MPIFCPFQPFKIKISQNDPSKVPTRCNLLPETGYACKDRSTPSGRKSVYRKKKSRSVGGGSTSLCWVGYWWWIY